jgi:YD repeat-containing protein
VTDSAGLTSYTRDRLGRPGRTTFATGATLTRSFDEDGRTTQVRYTSARGEVLFELSYTHDAAGRITHVREVPEREVAYRYDLLGRLIEEHTAAGAPRKPSPTNMTSTAT